MADFRFLDKRVQRTKLDLYDALFDLLEHEKYEEITVKDIVDQAGYSRGSFYNHFRKKDDLLQEIIGTLFEEAAGAQRTSYIQKDSIDVRHLENEPIYVLQHFENYREHYRILLGKNLTVDFHENLTRFFVNLYMQDFEMQGTAEGEKIDERIINRYYAYGLIGLIIDWILDESPLDAESFSKELIKTFKYSLGTIRVKNRRGGSTGSGPF